MTSPPLAGPPGPCCMKGFKHEGSPVGKTIDIAGIPTYISEPPSGHDNNQPQKVLLFYADVGGAFSTNNKLLQDHFAENGFVVLGIEYFFGDTIDRHIDDPSFNLIEWATSKLKGVREQQLVPKWLKAVKEIYGADSKYFCVGYCFGGPFVLETAASDDVQAAAFAHPAFLEEYHFQKLTKPLLMSCAEDDFTFSVSSRRRAEDIMVERKALYHIQVFSGTTHGFATRGNIENKNDRWAKEESARGIIQWFDRFAGEI